ncbi:cytoplasmic tRNA 2-thiolation protein 1 [Pancytospora philotis]|nr:cytoplasmic tRNA 2-thiolation protein 1 [Pancytospora philotis]
MACAVCNTNRAVVLRSRDRAKVCKECFYELFENEIHELVVAERLFPRGTRVGVGISGGKDSTVLAYVLDKLNRTRGYGVELVLLCVDEGIAGYRDRSIDTVVQNQADLQLPLRIVSFSDIFGLSMDDVVRKIGKRGNCTYCGTFRRQALEDAARKMGVDCIVTGHNADDMAETVLLNLMRGDLSRFRRCTLARTSAQAADGSPGGFLSLPRCKPFKYTYQKEIVLYAYYKKLPYFSTECTYAPGASRGDVRSLVKDLEKIDPQIICNLIAAAESFSQAAQPGDSVVACSKCAHPTSNPDRVCSACKMVEKLNSI